MVAGVKISLVVQFASTSRNMEYGQNKHCYKTLTRINKG